ncbi:hypothetical protein GCM10009565_86700 [Amycolatopsis albidoflavus]
MRFCGATGVVIPLERLPERRDVLVSLGEVLDPQVKMDLLPRRAVRPLRRHVVRRELHADARGAVHGDHVPIAVRLHLAAEHACPEREHIALRPGPESLAAARCPRFAYAS